MSLPQNFSPTEHLQDAIKRVYNKLVIAHFRDLGDEDWDPNITTPRSSARLACTHQERDSIHETLARMQLFQQLVDSGVGGEFPFYSIPIEEYQAVVKFQPQVVLLFQQRIQDVRAGEYPIQGRITVRILEDPKTITETSLKTLANKIKNTFGQGNGKTWRKGKKMIAYKDTTTGHQFQVLCRSRAEGEGLIRDVMQLVGETPDWSKSKFKETKDEGKAYPRNPGTQVLLGKSRKKPRKRPEVTVYFRAAYIHIHGIKAPIYLFDSSGAFPNALARSY